MNVSKYNVLSLLSVEQSRPAQEMTVRAGGPAVQRGDRRDKVRLRTTCHHWEQVHHAGAGQVTLGEEGGHWAEVHWHGGVGCGPPGHQSVGLPLDVCN